jgi:hypothetical protein
MLRRSREKVFEQILLQIIVLFSESSHSVHINYCHQLKQLIWLFPESSHGVRKLLCHDRSSDYIFLLFHSLEQSTLISL